MLAVDYISVFLIGFFLPNAWSLWFEKQKTLIQWGFTGIASCKVNGYNESLLPVSKTNTLTKY